MLARFAAALVSPIRRYSHFTSASLGVSYCKSSLFSCSSSTSTAMVVPHPKDDCYLQNVIPKRIRLFEEIQSQQRAQLESLPHDPIKITLPDGSVKEGRKWASSPLDIAKEIWPQIH